MPAGLQGWPLKFVLSMSPTLLVRLHLLQLPTGPLCSCPLHLLHLSNLSFIMQNKCCILELRAYQCFVSNFLRMPMCKGQIVPKKTHCLSCLS